MAREERLDGIIVETTSVADPAASVRTRLDAIKTVTDVGEPVPSPERQSED